jgi:hypothetical protein
VSPRVSSSDRFAIEPELDVDVAAGGSGVGAYEVRSSDEVCSSLPIRDGRQAYVEGYGELEPAVARGRETDVGGDGRFTGIDMTTPSHPADRALETGRVANSEQLLRIRSATVTTHLLGYAQVYVELAVVRATMAVAATRDVSVRGIEDLRHCSLLSRLQRAARDDQEPTEFMSSSRSSGLHAFSTHNRPPIPSTVQGRMVSASCQA